MTKYIKIDVNDKILTITLNRPEKLNAWHQGMRDEIVSTLNDANNDAEISGIVMTGAGDRAFSAGQDLEEAKDFDAERSITWIEEWERYYDTLRSLEKPLVIALNGVAAGSAFQVALLGDVRVAHKGVRMGQPEINSGIASVTGPWIMREMLGLSRTIELTLSGRLMFADECKQNGIVHHLVDESEVLDKATSVAKELAGKPALAMRLNKQRFREVTQEGFLETIAAAKRIHAESYGSGEPSSMMERFLDKDK